MKKKINLINVIILFFALSLFLIVSVFIVSENNYKQQAKVLDNHVLLINNIYNGDNEKEVIDYYKDSHKDIRITFISYTGEVIMDSSNISEFDNHLSRPEIEDLGVIHTRYSDTLNKRMMYIAHKDDGSYVRVAMPIESINDLVNGFLLLGILTLLIISFLSAILINQANKRALAPLNLEINKLSTLAGSRSFYNDDIDRLSQHVNDMNNIINDKINAIIDEKSKVSFIINNLNQGIVIVDSAGNIILLNKFVLDIKNIKEEDIINKHFIYLIRDINFHSSIENAINYGIGSSFDLKNEEKIYLVNITPVTSKWTGESTGKYGAYISIIDLTRERQIEKIKREFSANASHELKSPLTSIIGYQQMVTEGIVTTKEEILDASYRTIKEASRMHQIILEMLELSRLESKEPTKLENIDISDVVKDIVDSYETEIENKNIKLNLNLNNLTLNMNKSHLTQLVKNLVENGIKYNLENGRLDITVKADSRELIVSDSGIGISTVDQGRVFERFYRVDKARSKDQGGTGLGLAIVKHICNLYNANIIITSKLGEGTTMTIQFNKNTVVTE